MRTAAKIDRNQPGIVRALRSVGATVTSLAAVGKGCPDILVGRHGVNYLLEIKDGEKIPSKRKLTPAEQAWHDMWKGQVSMVKNEDEALRAIGVDPRALPKGAR